MISDKILYDKQVVIEWYMSVKITRHAWTPRTFHAPRVDPTHCPRDHAWTPRTVHVITQECDLCTLAAMCCPRDHAWTPRTVHVITQEGDLCTLAAMGCPRENHALSITCCSRDQW